MNPGIRISPNSLPGGRIEVKKTSRPQNGKLSLKADELQVGQRHEDVEWKQEYYIIIFPERT